MAEDLHFFAEQAPQVHKSLYDAISREQFDAAVKSLDERIPTSQTGKVSGQAACKSEAKSFLMTMSLKSEI